MSKFKVGDTVVVLRGYETAKHWHAYPEGEIGVVVGSDSSDDKLWEIDARNHDGDFVHQTMHIDDIELTDIPMPERYYFWEVLYYNHFGEVDTYVTSATETHDKRDVLETVVSELCERNDGYNFTVVSLERVGD